MKVGQKIQQLRKELGMSQEELGQRLLVSRQTISQWEIGQTLPAIDNLIRLRDIFGISIDEILGISKDCSEDLDVSGCDKAKKSPSKKWCIVSTTLFFASILTVFAGLIISALSKYDNTFIENFEIFFFLTPIPIASIILGIVLKHIGYKGNKNIQIGIIMTLFLCLYGALCFAFPKTYTVDFESNGGQKINSQTIVHNSLAEKPVDPIKSGFTFKEWQLDGISYDFDTPVTKDITLVATYTINEGTEVVSIALDYQNGRSVSVIEIEKASILFEPISPEKKGYTFLGWYAVNKKFDFSKPINDNLVLTAKWKKNEATSTSATTSNNKKPASSANSNTSSGKKPTSSAGNTSSSKSITTAEFNEFINNYKGRWYLEGYADVYVDIRPVIHLGHIVQFTSFNFSLPKGELIENSGVEPYTIYPMKQNYKNYVLGVAYYFQLDRLSWYRNVAENKLAIEDGCFYINGYKFIKTAGKKDIYSDTCYREALGTWYCSTDPTATLNITSLNVPEPQPTDTFIIEAINFNIETFSTESDRMVVNGLAAINEEWEKYGISVKDDVLTITNSYGTRTFYKNTTKNEAGFSTSDAE